MPVIHTHVSVPTTQEQRDTLKNLFGQAITAVPGKTENWLMCLFEDNVPMYFAGSDDTPVAYVEVNVFGTSVPKSAWEKLTPQIMDALQNTLGVPADHTYTRYTGTALQRDRAELTYEEQLTAEQKRPAQREQEIRTAYSDLAVLDAAVKSAADSLEQAEQNAAARRKQSLGLASGSTVRSAELAVSNAQLAYSRTVVQYNLSAAQLLANLGSSSARVTL